MSELHQREIFSRNLNRYIYESGLTQLEIAKVIGVSPQTFNSWCRGIAIPRMDKIQRLADFFKINKSDLIDDSSSSEDKIDSLFIKKYGQDSFDLVAKYQILDQEDRIRINERVDMLLEDDKYKKGSSEEKAI